MAPEERSALIEQAEQIASDFGYNSIIDCVAARARWERCDDLLIAKHDRQSKTDLILLDALIATGEAIHLPGYYGKDYNAGEELTHAVMGKQRERRETEIRDLLHRARCTAHEAGYHSLVDYVAAEANWEPIEQHHRRDYIARIDDQSPQTRVALKALSYSNTVIRGTGYCGRDYLAGDALRPTLRKMESYLEFAQQPPKPGAKNR